MAAALTSAPVAAASKIGTVRVCLRPGPNLSPDVVVPGDLSFEAYGHLKGDLRDRKSEVGDYNSVLSAHGMIVTLGKFSLSSGAPCTIIPARLNSLGPYDPDDAIRPEEHILFVAQRLYWTHASDALVKFLNAESIVAEVVASVGAPFTDRDVERPSDLRGAK